MKVKELIELLKTCDQEMSVFTDEIGEFSSNCSVDEVFYTADGIFKYVLISGGNESVGEDYGQINDGWGYSRTKLEI